MHRAATVAIAVLIAMFAIAAAPPAMASTTASCTSTSVYWDMIGFSVNLPTIGHNTHRDNCLLGVGNQSSAVTALQVALSHCYRRIAIDGVFGPQTEAALRYAQKSAHIPADGVYGPQTRDHIQWYDSFTYCAPLHPPA